MIQSRDDQVSTLPSDSRIEIALRFCPAPQTSPEKVSLPRRSKNLSRSQCKICMSYRSKGLGGVCNWGIDVGLTFAVLVVGESDKYRLAIAGRRYSNGTVRSQGWLAIRWRIGQRRFFRKGPLLGCVYEYVKAFRPRSRRSRRTFESSYSRAL